MTRECPNPACEDGTVLVSDGSFFSMREEQYFPRESEAPCDECRGKGWVDDE